MLRVVTFSLLPLALGCSFESRLDGPPDTVADSSTSGSEQPPNLAALQPQASLPESGDRQHAGGEWKSEQITSEISSHLHAVSQFVIARAEQGDNPSLDLAWVAPQFQAENPRPANTQVVFTNRTLEVSRGRAVEGAREHAYQGRAGFRELLDEWLVPLVGCQQVVCKFKVVGIERKDDFVVARIHAHLSGAATQLRREENSNWQSRWRMIDGRPELVDLTVADYELAQLNGGTYFRDATTDLLGDHAAYNEQLRFGLHHWLDRFELGVGILPTGYQGIAVGDINGDGLDDLFVAQPGGVLTGLPNRLFVQRSDGSLDDISHESQLDWFVETHGALFVDLDNDDDQDLVIATVAGLAFMENVDGIRFRRRATKLMPEAPPMSLAAADYDGDGDLDIYACCYSHRSSSDIIGRPLPYHDANNGGRNALFRNEGRWQYRNVVRRVGLEQNNRRFSFAAAWDDFDNDGDQDLYVSNDYGRNNLYRNDEGQFVDVAAMHEVEDISAGMSAAWGDYDRDGWMDIYVGNMWSSAGKRVAYQRQFQPTADDELRATFQRHARGNSLFRNTVAASSKAAFEDVSVEANVTMGRWAWSSKFADINNDGWQDLIVANGFITQEDDRDL